MLTNNNPLTYVFTIAPLDATGHRWLAELSNYHFSIKYCSGKKMQMRMHYKDYRKLRQ